MAAAAASGDDLHLDDLGSSLVAVAAAIAGASGVSSRRVATGVSAALLVDDLDDLDRATGTVSAVVATTTAATSVVAAASVTTASTVTTAAQAESALQVGSAAAATSSAASKEAQEASVGHSEQSTHTNEDLEGDEAFWLVHFQD